MCPISSKFFIACLKYANETGPCCSFSSFQIGVKLNGCHIHLKSSLWCSKLSRALPRNIWLKYYFGLIQLPPIVHFVPPIDLTSWFPILELLWLNLDPLPQLVPLFEMRFLLFFALQFYLAVSLLLSLLLKPVFSHGALHTGSASERFTLV